MSPRTAAPARNAGGFVDNARALPTTPPAPQQQPGRTFHSPYKADIFTRSRQWFATAPWVGTRAKRGCDPSHCS